MAKSLFTNLVCEICSKSFSGRFCRVKKTCSKECLSILKNRINIGIQKPPHTQEWKDAMSKRFSGAGNPFFRGIMSESARKKIADSQRGQFGELSRRWIKDRTKVRIDVDNERGGPLNKQWSRSVKNRDGWKCRISNKDCSGRLESHHILGWKDHPELRYEVNNGITLCHFHHPRKRNDELRLSPYFQTLVASEAK